MKKATPKKIIKLQCRICKSWRDMDYKNYKSRAQWGYKGDLCAPCMRKENSITIGNPRAKVSD